MASSSCYLQNKSLICVIILVEECDNFWRADGTNLSNWNQLIQTLKEEWKKIIILTEWYWHIIGVLAQIHATKVNVMRVAFKYDILRKHDENDRSSCCFEDTLSLCCLYSFLNIIAETIVATMNTINWNQLRNADILWSEWSFWKKAKTLLWSWERYKLTRYKI